MSKETHESSQGGGFTFAEVMSVLDTIQNDDWREALALEQRASLVRRVATVNRSINPIGKLLRFASKPGKGGVRVSGVIGATALRADSLRRAAAEASTEEMPVVTNDRDEASPE